jgi:uncharacterized protein with HEPN domain
MTRRQQRPDDYLSHILQAIERIHRYTDIMDEAGFLQNEMAQDAVIPNIEIIGEAARNIERHCPKFASEHSEIPWEDIYLMRNRVAHGYFSVDLAIVWKAAQRDIPELELQVKQLRLS